MADQRAIDRADAPPPGMKCWDNREARSLIAAAALHAVDRAECEARLNGQGAPLPEETALPIAGQAAYEMDDLIAREGIELARAHLHALYERDRIQNLEPWQREGFVPRGKRTPENWPPKDWDPSWRLE